MNPVALFLTAQEVARSSEFLSPLVFGLLGIVGLAVLIGILRAVRGGKFSQSSRESGGSEAAESPESEPGQVDRSPAKPHSDRLRTQSEHLVGNASQTPKSRPVPGRNMKERIEVIQGDITTLEVEGIVNAANTSLLGGGGVDGAVHRAAGPRLLNECRTLNGCPTGEAKITEGYELPALKVIHTVGPIWRGGNEDEPKLLANCYRNSLDLARRHQLKSLAIPAISCGVYGYPVPDAVSIALQETWKFLSNWPSPEKVIFCCFGEDVFVEYQRQLQLPQPSVEQV